MTTTEQALVLPEPEQFRRDIQAINQFQRIVRAELRDGVDFGVIPGTRKPTLLKPGAEKIAKLLGLADEYEVVECTENWEKGFFHYLVRCRLIKFGTPHVVSTGLGECNSMETKYRYRWLWGDEADTRGIDKAKAVKRTVTVRGARVPQYRVDNDEVYSVVNTLLKMAKKRALVDAALSAGRLSELFTQDIEEMQENGVIEGEGGAVEGHASEGRVPPEAHYCAEHKADWFKRGNMRDYAHPIKDAKGNAVLNAQGKPSWCNEVKAIQTVKDAPTEAEAAEAGTPPWGSEPDELPAATKPAPATATGKRMNFPEYENLLKGNFGKAHKDVAAVLGMPAGAWLDSHKGSGYEEILKLCEAAWA